MKKIMFLSIMLLAVAINGCEKDEPDNAQPKISLKTRNGTVSGTVITTGGENISPFTSLDANISEYGVQWEKTTESDWKTESKSIPLAYEFFGIDIDTKESDVNYDYRAFVKTKSNTYYGEKLTAKTRILEQQFPEWKNLTSTFNTNDLHGLILNMKIEGNSIKLTYTHNSDTKTWEYCILILVFKVMTMEILHLNLKKTLTAPDELYFSFEYKTSSSVRFNVSQLTNYEEENVWVDMTINP